MENSLHANEHEKIDADLRALFESRLEISNRLTKIETILDGQTITLNKILELTSKTNGRVSSLENWRSKMVGINVGISLVISTLITIIGLVFSFFVEK